MSLHHTLRQTTIEVTLAVIAGLAVSAQAVVSPSTDAALQDWAAKQITDRPGLPPLGTRSPQAGALSRDPGADTLLLMDAHVAGARAKAVAATAARALAEDPDNVVHATTFSAADGSTREFAAHFRPDDARPLYLRASGYAPAAGAGFEQAHAALIERVLDKNTAGLRVTALPNVFSSADQNLRAGRNAVTPPWPRCWVFFVDDRPLGEWEHPCRYVFLAEDLSAFAVQYGRSRLEAFASDGERVWFSLVVSHPVVDAPSDPTAKKPASKEPDPPPVKAGLDYSGSGQNCYAVIISGGADRFNNWGRYWNNCSQIYSTLRQKYNVPESHITILMSDGTNVAADRNIGTDVAPVYVNTDPDIDQDGDDDIDFSCTHANVVDVLNDLAATLTSNDQLFIYVTDHGYQESGHDAGINLWNWEGLRDDELEDLTDGMACQVLIAMGTCHSGGFIDDFAGSVNNRALAASCRWDEGTDVGWTWPNYTQWLYCFSSGVRGFFPAAGPTPYQDGAACDADADNDARVDFHEAWTYATANCPPADHPQWEDNAAGFGDTVYLNHLHMALANDNPDGYSQIPKDFSFEVKTYDWAAVGIAPSTDHNLQADNNRQLTSPYRICSNAGTARDFIVYNGHMLASDTLHYAQVYSGGASSYQIEAEWEAYDAGVGVDHATTLGASEVLDLYECSLADGTTYDIKVNITSGTGDAAIYVFTPGTTHGSRSTASWIRNAAGAGGDETLRFRATEDGLHGIVVVNENGAAANYTFTADEAPPLSAPTGVAATDGSYTDRVRVTWNSVTDATHYRVYRNTVNNSGTASALIGWTAGTTYDDTTATAGRTYYYWVKAAASYEGDRESGFSASTTGYVQPATLASDSQVTASSASAYYRAGGEGGCTWWWVVGVRYHVPGENWSLKLYDGPGFGSVLETSAWSEAVDFVVVDGNHVGADDRGVEAYRVSGSGNATVEFEGYGETLPIGSSAQTWPAGDVVEMWDVRLTNNTTYRFTLDVTSGTNDFGMAVFSSGDGDYHRARAQYAARSDSGGAGVDEVFTFTATATDDYGLCVWANNTNATTTSFTIRIEPLAAGLWEGDISANWHTPGNWNDGFVPDAADDVTIPTGAPRFPMIYATNAACKSLAIGSGASLVVSNRSLSVSGDFVDHGRLVLSNSTACKLNVGGNVYWEEAATCAVTGSAEMYVTGNWNFEDGANVQLTSGYVEFQGTGNTWIRVYDGDCRFYNVRCDKSGGGIVRLSPLCAAPIHVNNLYQYSASTLYSHTEHPLMIDGFFNNMGGHFRFYDGSLVYEGSPTEALKPNTNDFLNNLVISGPGKLVLDATYTNTLPILGSVELLSGGLVATNLNLLVGGNWSNHVGAAGFTPGTYKVTFNGVDIKQTVAGTNTFYNLVDARSGDDQLLLRGPTTVQHDFTVNYQTAVWAPLAVQNTLDLSNPGGQLILWGSADVQAAKIYLTGELLVYSGSLVAADLLNNGLYGYIDIRGGEVSLTQGTGAGQYFDLYGTLKMTGGRLDLFGGNSDHYWPVSGGSCTFVMNGGILDFHNQGWQIRAGFSGGITNGTLRCAENVISRTPAFAPVGGLLELYGTAHGQLWQTNGSTFPSLRVSKTGGARAEVTSDLAITGNVDIQSGILRAFTNTLSLTGHWTNGVGAAGFVEDTSTVRFVGSAAASIQSDETFYKLQVAKTYTGFTGLETARSIRVLNDLVISDGTMELNTGAVLDVDRDILIANSAGLNANDPAPIEIHVGRHWSNLNASFSSTQGFDPGYGSLVVFDGGAVSGNLSTAASEETFDTVRIDRPGGTLQVLDALLLRDDLTILNGNFSYSGGPFTHRLRGDLTIETGGAWYDTVSTVVFDGTVGQNLNHKSMNGWFKHMIVEKNTGIGIIPLTLQTNVLLLNGGTLTVREGYMDLNGHYVRCTGNVTVEKGGKLLVDAGAELEVGQTTLEIQGGGLLDVRGAADRPATVQAWDGQVGHRYAFLLRSNAVLRAENAVFEHLDAGGLQVQPGAVVEEPFTFHDCTFQLGTAGGTLLDLQSTQVFTIRNASFPVNPGGGASNVRKTVRAGSADFVHATGIFAGESYDNDSFSLIDWHTGGFTLASITGPTAATMGGEYDFTANVTGDLPLTPITYYWTVTGHTPVTHSHGNLTDPLADRKWTTPGTKSVQVTVSNLTGTAQANLSVEVQALDLAILGRQWVGPTNAVSLLLKGTSASSTYQVQYRTNLTQGYWSNAIPDGVSVPGLNGQTSWLDLGGPGRDVTTSTQLLYRVVLPMP